MEPWSVDTLKEVTSALDSWLQAPIGYLKRKTLNPSLKKLRVTHRICWFLWVPLDYTATRRYQSEEIKDNRREICCQRLRVHKKGGLSCRTEKCFKS